MVLAGFFFALTDRFPQQPIPATLPRVAAKISWKQALAWRMRRQLLDPVGDESAVGVVRRLCAVQAQVASFAELCVRVRRTRSKPGDVGRALIEGRLIKTWAMRGTLHLLTPQDAGTFLSLIAAGRSWERPSWQRYFGVTPSTMERLRAVVRDALDGAVLSREELVAAVARVRGLGHVADGLRSGWGTLLKPLAWQGDLCFGPSAAGRLLPGFDQYVLGPGTGDARVVPSAHRAEVSKQCGWIAPVVVRGGVVCGTWELDMDQVRVAWFAESGRLPRSALRAEV